MTTRGLAQRTVRTLSWLMAAMSGVPIELQSTEPAYLFETGDAAGTEHEPRLVDLYSMQIAVPVLSARS
jgi:hypothetical protein